MHIRPAAFLFACTVTLIAAASVQAGTVFYFDSGQTYSGASDSPFYTDNGFESTSYYLEDFEDGALNSLGLSSSFGTVRGPSNATDSVDGDGDGVLDGQGQSGYALLASNPDGASVTFSFDSGALGGLPTFAGLVWTDGNENATVTFEAFGAGGESLGSVQAVLGDTERRGSTAEDRFFGVVADAGISAIRIFASIGSLELDHIQYGFAPAVVPLPPAAALGLAGLGLLGLARMRRRK